MPRVREENLAAIKEKPALSERHHLENCPETDRNGRTESYFGHEPPSAHYPAGRRVLVIRCQECGGQDTKKGV